MCFNCGGLGHSIKECKLPINQQHIDIRKNLVFGKRRSSDKDNNAGDKNNGADQQEAGGGKKNKNKGKNTNPLTVPPKSGEPDEKTINGTKLYWCTKCAKWTTHKTSGHPPDNENQGHHAQEDDDEEDIGDDSESGVAGHFASATGFLSSSSTHF